MKRIMQIMPLIAGALLLSFTYIDDSNIGSLQECYLTFDNIIGDALNGGSQVVQFSGGIEYVNGKSQFRKLSVTVKRDKATPLYYKASLDGSLTKNVKIEQLSLYNGDEKYVNLEINLKDVTISYMDLGSSDNVRLDLTPKTIKYTYRKPNAGAIEEYSYGWDYINE